MADSVLAVGEKLHIMTRRLFADDVHPHFVGEISAVPARSSKPSVIRSSSTLERTRTALARNPIRGVTASVPMITKGGLETVTQHLAMEYAKCGIRVNAVAPGVVYTPLHRDTPKEVMEGLSPMGRPSTVRDITDAVMYLTDAATVTGDILYVDGGSHFGRW